MLRWVSLAVILAVAAPVGAQSTDPQEALFVFDIQVEQTMAEVAVGDTVEIPFIFHDRSRDSTGGAVGQDGAAVQRHQTTWSVIYDTPDRRGWHVQKPGSVQTLGGESRDVDIRISANQFVSAPILEFSVVARTQTPSGIFETTASFAAITPGSTSFNAQLVGSLELQPSSVAQQVVRITNAGLLPREFALELRENSCGLTVAHDGTVMVPPKSTSEVLLDVRGPTDRFWYNSELCQIQLAIFPLDSSDNVRSLNMNVQVTGTYINTAWVFWAIGAAAVLFVLAALAHRRKQAIEEEILGKPQKPWTIPVERVYLEHLEAKDPRAAYVVRHFLMEEEYASSLLWYKHYKKATKGERSKEALVVRQEKKYERFQNKWQKRIQAPIAEADRFEAKLQKKLDRQAKKAVRKDRRKWKKLVARIEKAHAAQEQKANAKWEKAAAKAEKKGQPAPPKPQFAPPDLPEEPTLQKIHLADHKWNKKATKFRKKQIKRQGDLEVKFEKKDARMLHKLRRKVNRIARKLDDPDIADEHPLLARQA